MRLGIVLAVIAVGALATARVAREAASELRPPADAEVPYSPSPAAAPIVSLGYREPAADLLWIRFLAYFGGSHTTAQGLAGVIDAILALDPRFRLAYEHGPRAMTMADEGVDQATYHHAIDLLERGTAAFSEGWQMPLLAGQIYLQDLKTDDPDQRRKWDEKGTLLIESAIRKPGSPPALALYAAQMRSKLGQMQQAIDGLREMILLTSNEDARKRMIARLATLESSNADAIANELELDRLRFTQAWHRERPRLPSTMYILLGKRIERGGGFDLTDLATGGRDLVAAPTSEDGPSSP